LAQILYSLLNHHPLFVIGGVHIDFNHAGDTRTGLELGNIRTIVASPNSVNRKLGILPAILRVVPKGIKAETQNVSVAREMLTQLIRDREPFGS